MIVTIDGPAGSGKSTLAQLTAKRLGWIYLDTGAMYRAVAWKARRSAIEPKDVGRLDELCRTIQMDFHWSAGILQVAVDGQDATRQLRDEGISELASAVAMVPQVRQAMVSLQRTLAKRFANVITEGRDQGSVVFPDADLKIFLGASVEERAHRRCRQLRLEGQPADEDQILLSIKNRDRQDESRAAAPLVVPEGAIRLDTTDLTIDQMVSRVLELIRQAGSK